MASFLGYNRLKVKDDANLIATFGDDVFIALEIVAVEELWLLLLTLLLTGAVILLNGNIIHCSGTRVFDGLLKFTRTTENSRTILELEYQ